MLMLSTKRLASVAVYPDSDKVGVRRFVESRVDLPQFVVRV